MNGLFRDRSEAGLVLAPKLREFAHRTDVMVLALPRGGVTVGFQLARKLHAPLDVLIVRKLAVPGREEIGMGAITTGGVEFWDRSTIAAYQVPPVRIDDVVRRERAELERCERAFRGVRPFPLLHGKTVIIADDGIATAFAMQAAVRALELKRPRSIVIAAPVASNEAVQSLSREVAAVVTVVTSERPFTVGEYYRDFRDTTDEEIRTLLAKSPNGHTGPQTAAA